MSGSALCCSGLFFPVVLRCICVLAPHAVCASLLAFLLDYVVALPALARGSMCLC